jgi:hypothetical protein
MQKDFSSLRKLVFYVSTEEFEHDLEEADICLIVASTTFTQPEQEEKYPQLVEPILATYRNVLRELSD